MSSPERQPKRPKVEETPQPDSGQDLSKFFKAWAWKREHRPDKDRFVKPYVHTIAGTHASKIELKIKQAKFSAAGFASTVWDSSIVVSKLLEFKPALVTGARCLDLSAGCGLVGIVAANLGAAHVVATDLGPNLPLLEENCAANTGGEGSSCKVQVLEHTWGEDVQGLSPPFDLVLACDVMYVVEAVPDLIKTLQQVETLTDDELHPEYQCSDVTVYRLTLLQTGI